MDGKWPRRAVTPAHAMLNYAYSILELEATMACHVVGLDPALGFMHADARYRPSLAADLMEPSRPIVDRVVLQILTETSFDQHQLIEARDGRCRLQAPLARKLAEALSCDRPAGAEAELVRAHLLNGGPVAEEESGRPRGRYRVRS